VMRRRASVKLLLTAMNPASTALASLSSAEVRLFVRAWILGFALVLLLIG